MFDTLAVAQQLAAGGVDRDQAEVIAKAIGETAPAVWSIPVDFEAKPIQADRRFSRSGPGNTCPGWLTGHPLSDADF